MSTVKQLKLAPGVHAEDVVQELEGFTDGKARVVVIEAGATQDFGAWPGELVRWLWQDYPLPVIFAFDKQLIGEEAALALGCDIRICDEGAAIQLNGGTMDKLTAARACTLLQLETVESIPAKLTGAQALEDGLVSRVGPKGSARELAKEVAEVIATRGPIATRLAKEALWRGLNQPLEQALRFETDLTLLLQATKDRQEGVRAFLEKRPPKFIGE
ncbi:MAG: hypothetical protein CL897_04415 [Dehalococcoidia bacterium]|nr:hypothetical protein [Dehalococcoidia bacterium]HCV00072.1 hypothetical protein [Dehalococcoidia bacterium]|tara:strand:+ start:297 stop:944 length:648 start_codon:yes stop_codon:yes gene_type:complete